MSIIQTLAALHALDPQKIGLGDYGSTAAFYPRQIRCAPFPHAVVSHADIRLRRSLSKVSQAQSHVVNAKTGKPVGPIPRIDFLLDWYGRNLPGTEADKGYDAGTGGRSLEGRIIHGDFKVDNMVRRPGRAVLCASTQAVASLAHVVLSERSDAPRPHPDLPPYRTARDRRPRLGTLDPRPPLLGPRQPPPALLHPERERREGLLDRIAVRSASMRLAFSAQARVPSLAPGILAEEEALN